MLMHGAVRRKDEKTKRRKDENSNEDSRHVKGRRTIS